MNPNVVVMLLALAAPVPGTQGAPAAGVRPPEPAVPIALGQSVVALSGPWKFQIGDDPRWADPGFDDSQWETVDLSPTPQTTPRGLPITGFVTGWTARGHAGYAGYAWYRLRVRIGGASGPLTLLAPEWFDDAFQVFADGRLVGSSGNFNGPVPESNFDNSPMFSLSPSVYQAGPDGVTLLAFRFYMAPSGLLHGYAGGMHAPPILGLPATAAAVWHVERDKEYRRHVSALTAALMYFFFALLIAMMFAFSRTEKILLWPLAACVLQCVLQMMFLSLVTSANARWMSEVRLRALIDFASTTAWYLWMLTWWAYLGLQNRRWLFHTIVVLGIVDLIRTEVFGVALRVGKSSHWLLAANSAGNIIFGATSLAATAAIAYLAWRGAGRRKWPLFLVLLFFALPNFVPLMTLLHMRTSWQPFGVILPYEFLCTCAMLFCFSIVLFQQFRASLQRQQAMEDDVKQAKEVQRFLVPEQMPKLAGWAIESEYRPAREVGGDFFQIIRDQGDGSLLIVAGDVAGKGLQAGMLVAMLVGAIRTESEHSTDPVRILAALNSRLHGRERAQATCLALRIDAGGRAILANAGHLPPYLNGEPIGMEGALPLGMIEDAQPSVMEFLLKRDDRLVLVSDGVVEATDANGVLFGFERLQDLLRTARSAEDVAVAAQSFGQEDDISVIAVRFTGAAVGARAVSHA